jgi:hypothetical protein
MSQQLSEQPVLMSRRLRGLTQVKLSHDSHIKLVVPSWFGCRHGVVKDVVPIPSHIPGDILVFLQNLTFPMTKRFFRTFDLIIPSLDIAPFG